MKINSLPITEGRFILNTSINENDLILSSFYELISLGSLKISVNNSRSANKNEKYIVEKGLRFFDFSGGYYKSFFESILEYERSINDPDRLREPIITPYRLVEKVSIKSNKNFKSLVATCLKEKEFLEEGILPWRKFILTSKGELIKDKLISKLNKLEELLKSNIKEHEQYLIKLIHELGPLVFLIEKLDRNALLNLKTKILNSAPIIVETHPLNLIEVLYLADLNCFNIDNFDLDIFSLFSD